MNNESEQRVIITDIRIPFLSMGILVFKWILATISVGIIFSAIGILFLYFSHFHAKMPLTGFSF